jgi:hypothetical protein
MIYAAGMTAIGLRSLRDATYDLLHPLKDFDAQGWPQEKRAAWIETARLFDRGPDSI